MLGERSEGYDLEGSLMGRCQHDRCGHAIVVSSEPVRRRNAPAVAGHKPRELVLGHRGAQVVADTALVLEELSRHHRADRVAAQILRPGATAAIPIEPGKRVGAARLQLTAKHIAITHPSSIGARGAAYKDRRGAPPYREPYTCMNGGTAVKPVPSSQAPDG